MYELHLPGTTYREIAGQWWACDPNSTQLRYRVGQPTTRELLDALAQERQRRETLERALHELHELRDHEAEHAGAR